MSERKRTEERVKAALSELDAPDERMAEERGRQMLEAALAEREHTAQRSRVTLRAGLALIAAGTIAALAMTPAGAEVREWIADRIDSGEKNADPRLTSLPTAGAVLVEAPSGAWVIREDGSKRRLGEFDEATWSPNGRFVGVTDGTELRAVDPVGKFRWSIEADAPVTALDWSPDEGFRVAYLAGEEIHVVTGDGVSESYTAPARPIGPAWRPESEPDEAIHHLSFVDPQNRVVTVDTDSGRVLWKTGQFGVPVGSLEWSDSGQRLLVSASGFTTVLDARGNPLLKGPIAANVSGAAISPTGGEIAAVTRGPQGTDLRLIGPAGEERRLYSSGRDDPRARFGSPVFSPDGKWILLPWPEADQWLFVNTDDRRVTAVADISRQFDADGKGSARFPEVAGWCC